MQLFTISHLQHLSKLQQNQSKASKSQNSKVLVVSYFIYPIAKTDLQTAILTTLNVFPNIGVINSVNMVLKNEELQEHTKRLRFKPLTNVQHASGDVVDSKVNKDMKTKGRDSHLVAKRI